jgi:hypothetical protein
LEAVVLSYTYMLTGTYYQVDFVLGEWSTGVYIKATFDETTNGERFKSHLKGVTEWRNDNPEVVDKICQKLFKRAM